MLWENGVVVFDNGSEVDMLAAEDVTPEVGWRGWGTSLGIKAADRILDVQVVDCPEDTSFFSIGDVSLM